MTDGSLTKKGDDDDGLATRTLIRAFEARIVSKAQAKDGVPDRQAPMGLTKRKGEAVFVAATTDRALAHEWQREIDNGARVVIQLHRKPTGDELDELSRQLPQVRVPHAGSPPLALPPVATREGEHDQRDAPPSSAPPRALRELEESRGQRPFETAVPTSQPGVEATYDRPFVLRIRDGRRVVAEEGPFAQIMEAIDAMRSREGEPAEVATIYNGGRVADYRGDRAVFKFGRTRWSRA